MPVICIAMMKGECVANPATGRCIWCERELKPDPRIATSKRRPRIAGLPALRPRIAGLPALQAQLSARHDLPMRIIADILDEVVPMLDLLTRVQQVVDAAKDGPAMAWLGAFAEIRDVLYPDTELARRLNMRRSMTPVELAAERVRANAAEAEAWRGIVDRDPLPGDPKHPEGLLRDESPPAPGDAWDLSGIPDPEKCGACGATLAEVRGHAAGRREIRGSICLRCASTGTGGTVHVDDES